MKSIIIVMSLTLCLLFSSFGVMADSEWNIETVDSEEEIGMFTSLALDRNDHPHISYSNYSQEELKYAFFDGNSWNIETVDSENSFYNSLSLDSNDHPHISYYEPFDNELKYAFFDGNSWNIETVDSEGQVGYDNSLSLDSNDHPHISYSDYSNGRLKYAFFDGNSWNIEMVDGEEESCGFTSLALDSNDHPHISYCEPFDNELKYAFFDGNSWNIETVDSEGQVGSYNSLSLDSNDHPHISYKSYYSNYYDSYHDLKYAFFDGNSWNIEMVDSEGEVGSDNSLSLDSNDHPHISYSDYSTHHEPSYYDLKYAFFDGSSWNIETVDSEVGYGQLSSLVLDSSDHPHISYCKSVGNEIYEESFVDALCYASLSNNENEISEEDSNENNENNNDFKNTDGESSNTPGFEFLLAVLAMVIVSMILLYKRRVKR